MSLIDLGSPIPHLTEVGDSPFAYPISGHVPLSKDTSFTKRSFDEVALGRRTIYGGTPLTLKEISALLWRTAFCAQKQIAEHGRLIKRKPSISGGARHPIDILVVEKRSEGEHAVSLYDDVNHALLTLDVDKRALADLWNLALQASRGTESTLFWFVAQPQRTAARYENPDSLIWRDAGALLQQFSLVASALSLGCVPLGPTGNPQIEGIFNTRHTLAGVGGCFVSQLQT
ncbi:nitroreductase family protein [Herbaspirillum huttiense]|uniref:nitroreductase family protein n=1 Tax=Herbaspirillum huttiense TaxID=863372 RepID=UPI003CD08E67